MAVKISDKNRREMSPERDFPDVVPVRRRYCILSSPRSGSTLLGRMLHATGLAGDPQEYFNPPLLAVERERSGEPDLDLNRFLKRMEARRTSPNGVFGMKVHYSQMLGAFRDKRPNQRMVAWLRRFQHLLWIRRRDRLRQAISQVIGQQTQVWSSEDPGFGQSQTPPAEIHPFFALRALGMVAGDDFGWERLIQAADLPVHLVWYEDLVADYEGQSRAVLDHLGLGAEVTQIPPPPIQRQAGEANERLHGRLLDYLGLGEARP